jgi:hypothetical protein
VTLQKLGERGGVAVQEAGEIGEGGDAKVDRLRDEVEANWGQFSGTRQRT